MPRILDIEVELPVLARGGGLIDSISVNGVEQEIVDMNVDITVPENTSELNNDSNFVASSELSAVATSGDYNDLDNVPTDLATTTDISNAVSSHNSSNSSHSDIRTSISDINDLIPTQASSLNQLADKSFVNSSINSAAAFFRGNFATRADLMAYTGPVTNNDYAYVEADETHSNEAWRYIYVTGEGWQAQFRVNETPFTAAQLAAINSGITDTQVAAIGSNTAAIVALDGSVGNKVNKTGDTMTGDLTLANNVCINFTPENDKYKFKFDGGTSYFSTQCSTNGGRTYVNKTIDYYSQNKYYIKNNVYTCEGNTINDANAKKLATEESIFKTGIVSDTKTWTHNSDGSYSYVASAPVSGNIPIYFIDIISSLGAVFNSNTGYFELNGLTDITYKEMLDIYNTTCQSISYLDNSGLFAFSTCRTNFFRLFDGTGWGNFNGSNLFRGCNMETICMAPVSVLSEWTDDTYDVAVAIGSRGYIWSGGTSWTSLFYNATKVKHIRGLLRNASSTSTQVYTYMFYKCYSLQTVWLYGWDRDIDLQYSPNLELDSVKYAVVKRWTGAGASAFTIKLHPNAYETCQADTTQYTYGGNTYTGIIAYAAARNITITSV